jgi:ribosomal protein S18 acetylase RimI-like enzyme
MVRLRVATTDDAQTVAELHADSWRRFYRGAYADAFLDGDVVEERYAVGSRRLAEPGHRLTMMAEDDTEVAGFVHIEFDIDDQWGSLIDNLHVRHDRRRGGVGRALVSGAAQAAVERARHRAVYLWVLEQNDAAQRFYRAIGGVGVETKLVPPPGGDPARLAGAPRSIRMAWPDASTLTGAQRQ